MAIISHQEASRIARQYYNNNAEFRVGNMMGLDARVVSVITNAMQSLGRYLQHYGTSVRAILANPHAADLPVAHWTSRASMAG